MLKLDQALADQQISGMMLVCYENDRPLQGAIAELDWRFNGHFTKLIKQQILTGAKGEVLYAPLRWNDQTLHFLILGGGIAPEGKRKSGSAVLLEKGFRKIEELKLDGMGVSLRDWNLSEDHAGAKERGICVVH